MNQLTFKSTIFAFFLTAALILTIFSNTINASWHLDDMKNIVENPNIQIKILSITTLKNVMFSDPDNPSRIYRPLSCLTFAINAFFGGADVAGYHIFNIILHILSSAMLFMLLNLSFQTPALESTPDEEKHFTVIFTALLWSINPIQTQALTYIVQRMALLSAFFSFFSLVFFLKARLSVTKTKRNAYSFISLLGIILSTLSKENGLATVLLIIFFEYILFRGGLPNFFKSRKFLTIFAALMLMAITVCYLLGFSPFRLFNYSERTFTLTERILTQPRVLIFYLSQILFPSPQRLSIDHDIIFSTGLLSPPQTVLSIFTIFAMMYAGLFFKWVHPIVRLAILFFFGSHIVESSVLPLEMMFEHRNYLPSAFIFAPLGVFIFRLSKRYETNKPYLRTIIAIFLATIIFLFSIGTYSRNFDWLTEESLWKDAIIKAPYSARPKHNMGYFYETRGEYDKALLLYNEALTNFYHHKKYKADTLGNIGNIYSMKGDYEKAHQYWDKAIEINPELASAYFAKTEGYIRKKKWKEAINLLDRIIEKAPDSFYANKFAAICNIHTGDYQKALKNLQNCLLRKTNDKNTIMRIAETLSLFGYPTRSDFFYKLYSSEYPKDPFIFLGMAKNNYLNGDYQKSAKYMQAFFRVVGIENIHAYTKSILEGYEQPMIGFDKMADFVNNNYEEYKKNLNLFPFTATSHTDSDLRQNVHS